MTSETMPVPKGWEMKRLGDILQIQNGYAFKSTEFIKENVQKNYVPLIRQSQLVGNTVDLSDCVYLDKKYLLEKKNYIVNKGDILIGMSGSIGKVSFYENDYPALLNQRVGKLNVYNHNTFQKDFFAYLLLSLEQDIIQMAKGMGVQNISSKDIEQLEIPVPPLATQQAIVNKIETLFAEIDAGIASLKTAEQQLKQYRQALLKNAFNGELTKQWRAEHAESLPSAAELLEQIQTAREQHHAQQLADWQSAVKNWEENGKQGKKPSKPTLLTDIKLIERDSTIPSNWLVFPAEFLCDFITKGTTPSKNELYAHKGEIPFLKVYNLTKNGSLDFTIDPTFVSKETHNNFLRRSKVYPNDVLMNIVGPPLGKVSIVPDNYDEWNINQAIVIYRSKFLNAKFLASYLLNEKTIKFMSSQAKTTAGQHNLTLEICRSLPIPYCSLAEQTQIVAILESKLTACDQLATELATQLKQAELLKQAVLKAAFSGKLLEPSE